MNKKAKALSIASLIVLTGMLAFTIFNFIFSFRTVKESAERLTRVSSVKKLKSVIEESSEDIGDHVLFHDTFIDSYSWAQRLLSKHEINNYAIIKDDEGMMYYGSIFASPLDEIDAITDNTAKLDEIVKENGGHFIVVLPPSKILYGVSSVDCNLPLNNPNAKMDKYLSELQQRNVDTVDMRIPFSASGLSITELFFKTDHHWKPVGAFIGTKYLVDVINSKYGYNLDETGYYTDLSNYDIVTYKDKMLGTHGRNTGMPYSGLDDFDMIYLKDYEGTSFTYAGYDSEGLIEEREGNEKECLVDWNELSQPPSYTQGVYATYLHSLLEHETIINKNNPDGLRILVCRDSYFSPVAYFMAPYVHEINLYYNQDEGAREEFMDKVRHDNYDLVILEVYPYNIKSRAVDFFEEDD